MREIILIRHGATAGNLERRYIGRTDEPLCPAGISELLSVSGNAPRPDIVFVSPMLRAIQTAELLFPDMQHTICSGLREMDFGIFEGKTADELATNPEYISWVDDFCSGPIPGGDSVVGFKARCRDAFLSALDRVPEGSRAAFVIHGGVIMAILEALAEPKKGFYEYHIGNGQFVLCRENGGILTVVPSF